LENQKDYYVSVVRASIPTSSIPRLIVPIETGITQTDKNKTLYKVRIKLCTGVNPNGTLIFNEAFTTSNNVTFVSQLPFEGDKTPPPSQNNGSQFLDNDYYYVYDVEALLKMFNDTLNTTFTQFCAQVGLPQPYNAAYAPHILWNSNNRLFELKTVADVAGLTYFDDSIFPNLVFQCDLLSSDLFQLSGSATADAFINNYSFNKYNNETIVGNVKYYTMTATQSSLNNWGSFSKVIFSISYGISTIQEYDSVPTPDQGSTNSYNLNKPSVPMLTDIEVDKDAFSINNNFIQYQTSSITQSRLISMTGSMLQSFQLSVYWLDVFGVRHSLSLPEGLPLTIKLGFYPKTTTLI
jgi:hypothetical protein